MKLVKVVPNKDDGSQQLEARQGCVIWRIRIGVIGLQERSGVQHLTGEE